MTSCQLTVSISSYHRKRNRNFHLDSLDSAPIPAKDNGEQKVGYCLHESLQAEGSLQQGLQPQTLGPSMERSIWCGDGTTTAAASFHSGGSGSNVQWSQYMQENNTRLNNGGSNPIFQIVFIIFANLSILSASEFPTSSSGIFNAPGRIWYASSSFNPLGWKWKYYTMVRINSRFVADLPLSPK